ncbi:glycosyltransferase [Crocinitomix algicola]|uniref:glycosyltransferase n=1 Tax=Crocinitomix algicola TaxID=1740263 RepID=UPI00158674B8|nr:glycosyltransferase [Crocinitomix algicola]
MNKSVELLFFPRIKVVLWWMVNQLKDITNQKILLSALDWGMGHLTRSTALMAILLHQGNELIFAGNKKQCEFILGEFPNLKTQLIPGYEIRLDSKKSTFLQLTIQFPRIKKVMKTEQNWVESFLKNEQVDLIISDNRYGFYSKKVKSIILTHQINLQIPRFKKRVNATLSKWLDQFNEIWVPDYYNRKLTGALSAPNKHQCLRYIGPLCRFKKLEQPIKYDYLIILSGPEPERTSFLARMKEQFLNRDVEVAFVGAAVTNCDSYPNPSTQKLNELIAQSRCIISRAGYTTIMEMVTLKKKSILYPTKGQFEQEYLANTIRNEWVEFQN